MSEQHYHRMAPELVVSEDGTIMRCWRCLQCDQTWPDLPPLSVRRTCPVGPSGLRVERGVA